MVQPEYEMTILINPEWSPEQVKEIWDKVHEFVAKHHGTMLHDIDLGKRPMAYEIAHHNKATYLFFDFCADGGVVKELERFCRLNEGVLRFLSVRTHEGVDLATRQSAVEDDVKKLQQYFGLAATKASVAKVVEAAEQSV